MQKMRFFFFFIGTLVMVYVMSITGKGLKTTATPMGIINLELAYNQSKIDTVVQAWTKTNDQPKDLIAVAKNNTYWDFLFLFFYGFLLFHLCSWVQHLLPNNTWGKLGNNIGKMALVAAALDIVENIFMLSILNNSYAGWYAVTMATASLLKWILVFITILYCCIGLLLALLKKNKQ